MLNNSVSFYLHITSRWPNFFQLSTISMLKTAKITDSIYTIRYQLHLFQLLLFFRFSVWEPWPFYTYTIYFKWFLARYIPRLIHFTLTYHLIMTTFLYYQICSFAGYHIKYENYLETLTVRNGSVHLSAPPPPPRAEHDRGWVWCVVVYLPASRRQTIHVSIDYFAMYSSVTVRSRNPKISFWVWNKQGLLWPR